MKRSLILLSLVMSLHVYGGETPQTRSDALTGNSLETREDSYLEGYIQALLNAHYYEFNIRVKVVNHEAVLYYMPKNKMTYQSIIEFVQGVPGVTAVRVSEGEPPQAVEKREGSEVDRINGVWFPQTTVLFPPLIADPREPLYFIEYRWGDKVLGKKTVGVAFGDTFPIYRWRNLWTFGGDLEIGITAGVWSVFKMDIQNRPNETSELINTSYLVGIPLSYAFDNWSFRLRIYHQSCHLGDEFMKYNPNVARVNPSIEVLDFFAQYQINKAARVYLGPGWVFNSDKSFPIKPLYFEGGFEIRALGSKFFRHQLYGTPFIAVNWRAWEQMKYRIDGTYLVGYEWSKLSGVGRKMRFYGKYHNGYSEGQFFKQTSSYWALGLSYGF